MGTPDDLWEWLNRRFWFNYDAFASDANRLRHHYSKVSSTVGCFRDSFILGSNGLNHSWENHRVFWNPPYSKPLFGMAVDKAIAERNNVEISVGLVKWDTSTEACRKLSAYAHVEPLKRVKYKGMKAAATFASAIVIMRPDIWTPPKGKK